MKKIYKRKIVLLIILILAVIIEIIAFGLSRAQNVKQITVSVNDVNGLLALEECSVKAINGGESGYYIVLPETLNNKFINKYYITEKTMHETGSSNEENINIEENIIDDIEENSEENIEENVAENVIIQQTTENVVEKLAGQKVYLTDEELSNTSITISVEYDTKEVNEQLLYNKKLTEVADNRDIIVEGYMPVNSEINFSEVNQEEIMEIISEEIEQDDSINRNI